MRAVDFIKEVQAGNINVVENTQKILEQAKKINSECHYLNAVSEYLALEQARDINKGSILAGLPISIKDNICVKGVESRAGSRILNGYKPLFDAAVVSRIKAQSGIIIGKTSQDEFGFGSFNTNVGIGFKAPLNPLDKSRATGGSSGGAAGLTKKLMPHIAIAESTGGSIVNPASFCGVYGLCPTYGLVSRYGLIDYANSLDKIGIMANYVEDIALMLNVIAGKDENDSTSIETKKIDYLSELGKKEKSKKPKIAVVKESLQNIDDEISNSILSTLAKNNIGYTQISLPLNSKYAVPAYYLIAVAEASTNMAKYCGLRYGMHEALHGNFNEYFTKVRSNSLGQEAKRRIILGTFARMAGYRDAYYLKALKARALLTEEYKKIFGKFDLLITPTMPIIAPKFEEIEKLTPLQNYMMDILTAGPNLAGLPHLNIPCGSKDNMPIGMLAIADHFNEAELLKFAHGLK